MRAGPKPLSGSLVVLLTLVPVMAVAVFVVIWDGLETEGPAATVEIGIILVAGVSLVLLPLSYYSTAGKRILLGANKVLILPGLPPLGRRRTIPFAEVDRIYSNVADGFMFVLGKKRRYSQILWRDWVQDVDGFLATLEEAGVEIVDEAFSLSEMRQLKKSQVSA